MAFWSSQRIRAEQQWAVEQKLPPSNPFDEKRIQRGAYKAPLILPFNEKHVEHGAYELALSEKVLITPDGSTDKPPSAADGAIKIPPGQFALLFTKECVNIPKDVIAFISLKGRIKFRGLVNISGFQVDPGFSGHLKFSVVNASKEDVHLNYGEPCFLIWFAELDQETEPYDGERGKLVFSPEDRDRMSEVRHSAESVHKRLEVMETKVSSIIAVGVIIVVPLLIGLVIAVFDNWLGKEVEKTSIGVTIIVTALVAGVLFLILNLWFSDLLKRFFKHVWTKNK